MTRLVERPILILRITLNEILLPILDRYEIFNKRHRFRVSDWTSSLFQDLVKNVDQKAAVMAPTNKPTHLILGSPPSQKPAGRGSASREGSSMDEESSNSSNSSDVELVVRRKLRVQREDESKDDMGTLYIIFID